MLKGAETRRSVMEGVDHGSSNSHGAGLGASRGDISSRGRPDRASPADGVELDGTYFRSPKAGRDAPCVMLVHKYGSDRSKTDWIALAQALQDEGFAVLTFDLRGHGGSTQLSNPQTFWSLSFNRSGIRNSSPRKTAISFNDFKPSYFPFIVNDLAAARRFLEQKNDSGELNVHSLMIIGVQEGAGLGFLFTAAEYARAYRIGVSALQSNGTPYNAGEDIAAGVWLSLSMRPGMPAGGPNLDMIGWVRNYPGMRDKTPMCFIYGDKDTRARADAESVFRVLSGPMTGRPDKHKHDDLHPIKGTDLAGSALLGQPALMVNQYVVGYLKKVMAERRAVPWTEVKPEINTLQLVPVTQFKLREPT
jgi:pimeloyl-ACP methyl ester carboxylesterase